jgi:hypothetical protein
MKKTRFGYIFLMLIILLPVSLGAADFGLLVNNYIGYGNSQNNDFVFTYRAGLVPRVSFLIGDSGIFFTSASMSIEKTSETDFFSVPELLRTELSFQFSGLGVNAGRFRYSDPLGFIVSGLFDGIQLTHSSQAGRFGLGAWYTGFLYKGNANITMSDYDKLQYNREFRYSNFSDTYFAPKRAIASLDWEHPSIGEVLQLNAAVTAQRDLVRINLSRETDTIDSMYFTLKAGIPINNLLIEAGGSLEAAQTEKTLIQISVDEAGTSHETRIKGSDDFLAFAGELGFYLTLPTDFNSRLSFLVRYASGTDIDRFEAFVPITTRHFGEIFQARMTGLTVLSLAYTARVFDSLGASFTTSYFIRNDLVTPNSYPLIDTGSGRLLGGEGYARLVVSPVSDLQFISGGGAFFPFLGNNTWQNERIIWRLDLFATFALY